MIKKIVFVFVIICLLLGASYFVRTLIKPAPNEVENEMQSIDEQILASGEIYEVQRLEESGVQAGDLLESTGTALTGNKPEFSFDKIRIRYYYIAFPCFDVIRAVDEKLGNYAEIEHVEDVNAYSQEQTDAILENWGNHVPEEEFLGETRQFPMVIYYGPGIIEENGVQRKMEAIEDGKPGFVVVNTRASACCEKCLMFSACQSLTKPPKVCEQYNYPIRRLSVDIEPTLPGE